MTWYHVSDTWTSQYLVVEPKVVRADDSSAHYLQPCICVCPDIVGCILALGDWRVYFKMRVYSTQGIPHPINTFDSALTGEHRFYQSQEFTFVQEIDTSLLSSIPFRTTSGVSDALVLRNLARDRVDILKALMQ